jgi:aminopeptidase N
VYGGGSLVLYALRQVVGERTFSEIERSWVKKYKDESVSTEQFIAHVNKVSHRNLTSFLRHWLYDGTVPPMPGHPDWTPDPVAAAAAARSAAAPSAREIELGLYKR